MFLYNSVKSLFKLDYSQKSISCYTLYMTIHDTTHIISLFYTEDECHSNLRATTLYYICVFYWLLAFSYLKSDNLWSLETLSHLRLMTPFPTSLHIPAFIPWLFILRSVTYTYLEILISGVLVLLLHYVFYVIPMTRPYFPSFHTLYSDPS